MRSELKSLVLDGSRIQCCTLESALARGFSGIQCLGLHSDVIKNARERLPAAIEACDIKLTQKKIIVSCSPQQTQVFQAHLDLAIAACISLLHLKSPPKPPVEDYIFLGELGLDGSLKQLGI